MKNNGISREWDFFEFTKHFCPKCKMRLKKVKVSEIVNRKSQEAKKYDFSMADNVKVYFGNIKFIKTEFFCERCNKQYKISEIKKYFYNKK